MPFTAENIYLGSGNPAFLTSTGAALYLNQQKLATESFVTGASGVLAGLISAASAGVSSLNGSSGVLNLLGAGNVTVTTAGQNITVSGNLSPFSGYVTGTFYTKNNESGFLYNLSGLSTGYVTGISGELSNRLFSTGSNLQTQINSITSATGAFSSIKITGGAILPLVNFTGVGLGVNVTNSGSFVYVSGDSTVLASVSNLFSTGSNLQGQINTINVLPKVTGVVVSGSLGITGQIVFSGIGSITAILSGNNVLFSGSSSAGEANTASNLGAGSGLFAQKSVVDLQFKSIKAGSPDIVITGSSTELAITFTGLYITSGSGVAIDAKTNSLSGYSNATFATISNLQTTGINLTTLVNSLSGFTTGNLSQVRVTGSGPITGANFTGLGLGITVTSSGQIVFVSGDSSIIASVSNLFTTGSTLNTLIGTSGQAIDNKVNLLSGYSNNTFATISNLQTTGINLTALTNSTGSLLDNKINNLSGFTTGAHSAVRVTGSSVITGANFTGVGLGITVVSSGQIVFVSGDSTIIASVANLQQTGINLTATFNTSGQAVDSKVNSLSGYSNSTFATISNLFTTGSTLDSKINSLSGFTTGAHSMVRVTGSTILTGANFTGVGLGISVQSSGQIVFVSGDATVLASVSNLFTTGSTLNTLIQTSGQAVDNKVNSLSGYSNTTFATVTNLGLTGSTLDNKINSLSGFMTGNYSTVRVTGSSVITGANFTGVGLGISVQSSGQIVFVSGDATVLASVSNLFTTGSTLAISGVQVDAKVNSVSGYSNATFSTITNLFNTGSNLQTQINVIKSAYVTGLQISGSQGVTGAVILSGIGGLVVIQSGYNTFLFSGGAGGGGEANTISSLSSGLSLFSSKVGVDLQLYSISGRTGIRAKREADNVIYFDFTGTATAAAPALTGSFIFRSGIQNGVTTQLINFPYNFSPNPRVIATLNNNISDTVIPFQVSGITNTGFTAIFSAAIPDTGYSLDVMVISQDSGLAINSFVSITTGSLIAVSGGQAIIGNVTLSGINGVTAYQSGQTVLFSGWNSGDYIDFTTTIAKPTYIEGRTFYDSGDKTLCFYPETTGVTMNIGQENWIRAINVSENTIANGKAVYVSGSVSGLPAINLARADSPNTSYCVGVTTMDILNNRIGYVTAFGLVHGMNLSGFLPGDKLYLSAATSGGLTGVAPTGLNYTSFIGTVSISGLTGNLLVNLDTNYRNNLATPTNQVIFDKTTGTLIFPSQPQNFNLFVDDLASRGTLGLVDNVNNISYMQDALWGKTVHNFWPNTTTTMNILGATATSAGTLSHPVTFNDLTGGGYATNFAAVAGGGPAGMQSNFTPFFTTSGVTGVGAGFFYTARFMFPDLSGTYCTGTPDGLQTGLGTGFRFFAGMTNAASILLTHDTAYPTAALVGFQLIRSSGVSGLFDGTYKFTVKANGASAQMLRQETSNPFRVGETMAAYIYAPQDFRTGIFWKLQNLTSNILSTGMFTGNFGVFLPQVNAATQTLLKPTFSFTSCSGAKNVKLKGMYCESL